MKSYCRGITSCEELVALLAAYAVELALCQGSQGFEPWLAERAWPALPQQGYTPLCRSTTSRPRIKVVVDAFDVDPRDLGLSEAQVADQCPVSLHSERHESRHTYS